MQVSIDNIVNQFRAIGTDAGLSADTMNRIVESVLAVIGQEREHDERIAEEGSMQNFQQRHGARRA